MIEELRIRGLGVIEEAHLDLGPGLVVVTGETGAGKTMLLTGLALLLGGRGDAALVRPGHERAEVEGRLSVAPDGPVAERVRAAGGDVEDGEVLLARVVAATGRARAYAGGRGVPATVLADLADDLVMVHGQGEQRWFARPARQREVLDRMGGAELAGTVDEVRSQVQRLRTAEATLADLSARSRDRRQRADTLRMALEQVERLAPEPAEDLALAAEAERLRHAELLRDSADRARTALVADADYGPERDVLALLDQARKALDAARRHDPSLDEPAARLREVAALTADLAADLASYAARVDTDPLRFQTVEERRAALGDLTRTHGGSVDLLLQWASDASRELLELDGDDERISLLQKEIGASRAVLGPLVARLSALRRAAAQRVGQAITAELKALAMPHARLRCRIDQEPVGPDQDGLEVPQDGGGTRRLAFGSHGADSVELVLSAHRGAPELPLVRAASGGELSRVMLAVQVVLAGADPFPTMVFDEVDAGVGGRAAVEVGHRLARLADSTQVLVVTHLAQVAAFADQHVVVRKSDDGAVTAASVTTLDRAGRVRELARMLAGLEDSRTAAAHAAELLALADSRRTR